MLFPTLRKVLTAEKMRLYAGEGNIHSDNDVARQIGLPGVIAQGGHLVAYLNEMMFQSLRQGYLEGGEISVAFIKSARPGDTIVTCARIREQSIVDGRTRTECDVWLENERGDRLVVGTASGFLANASGKVG